MWIGRCANIHACFCSSLPLRDVGVGSLLFLGFVKLKLFGTGSKMIRVHNEQAVCGSVFRLLKFVYFSSSCQVSTPKVLNTHAGYLKSKSNNEIVLFRWGI